MAAGEPLRRETLGHGQTGLVCQWCRAIEWGEPGVVEHRSDCLWLLCSALLDATLRTLDAGHPIQYGVRELPNGRTATWFHPNIPDDVTERYNRCPTCEQWSPCDVREAVEALTP